MVLEPLSDTSIEQLTTRTKAHNVPLGVSNFIEVNTMNGFTQVYNVSLDVRSLNGGEFR